MNILWLAPTFNHYKARFLNHLAKDATINLTVIVGAGRQGFGDKELEDEWNFEQLKVGSLKSKFGWSKEVRVILKKEFSRHDWVLVPVEKKNIPLMFYARYLQFFFSKTKIFSYNHPVLKSSGGKITRLDIFLTKWFYNRLDRVIFYTEKSCKWAVKNGYLRPTKAFWANNTVDTIEIDKHYSFVLPPKERKILFIGRLIASKRIPELLSYYERLRAIIPDLSLDIIGDGPESHHIKSCKGSRSDIVWHGTIVNEEEIASLMKKSSIVFNPGHSGLSVNHAFAYGRPYITLQGPSHAPELDYIDEGENGHVLIGDFETNFNTIKDLLLNRKKLEYFCNNAKQKGDYLSVAKWVEQIRYSLSNE